MSEDTSKTSTTSDAPKAANDIVEPKGESPDTKAEEGKPDSAAELARLRDQLLRTAADFDNFRKRSRREQDDAQKRGQAGVLKDLLPVFDNLERAAQHADTANDAKAVADGVRIVLKQFETTLERMGIKRIQPVGVAFDPALHEAIQHVESPDQPAGVVLHEVQAGYMIGESLLRAAMVVVSKGPGKGDVLPS
jgi:molecular chaperone GrpE